jgi:hypothetical protein
MYKQKSIIIEQIRFYHKQVAELYYRLFEKIGDKDLKTLVYDLYRHEKIREEYLAKHQEIAKTMDCWLDFPGEELSKQIADCLDIYKTGTGMTMEEVLQLEMHFDDCLIKLYNILDSENQLSETVANVFHYMLKKTRKEKNMLAGMLGNSCQKLPYTLTASSS